MKDPDNYNIEITGIQQEAPFVYCITISTYTNIGYRLDINYSGYTSLGTITYNGQKYEGMELTVLQDSTAEVPNTVSNSYIVGHTDPTTIGMYVKCGEQIETINFH